MNSTCIRGHNKKQFNHRDLKSDSHKRFPTLSFTCQAYVLGPSESKKDCLNYFCNRSAHHRPSRDSNPGPLSEHLLDYNLSSRLYNIDFTDICVNKTLKYFIVRFFLAKNILYKSSSIRIKIHNSDKNSAYFRLQNSAI